LAHARLVSKDDSHVASLRDEFGRAAALFNERTKGRFDDLGVVEFARVDNDETVLEVGAGAGNFLSLFRGHAKLLVAVDLVEAMLRKALEDGPDLLAVAGDAYRLPLRSRSVDLIASAQAFHHIFRPVPVLQEMRRVMALGGRILVVDQVSTESFEETAVRHELEGVRDPSHAATRPPSALRIMVHAAGLSIIDERIVEAEQRLSKWMWPGEFPPERIAAVTNFIEERGSETGMGFRRAGDDWAFTRRRMMILATASAEASQGSGKI
jgi:SAM-dependent methyltransferase